VETAAAGGLERQIETLYRAESRRVLATLIRLLRDFDLAEEALHEAFAAAAEQWARDGVPRNPRSWLVSAGRFKAIDRLRRKARFDAAQEELVRQIEMAAEPAEDEEIADDRLRLIFTCCHPALPPEAQLAMTLREVCGLATEEIAHAFLTAAPTVAQRIVRAKARIRDAGLPYEVPPAAEWPARLSQVLQVIYLVFNEGYSTSHGESVTRHDLGAEAIRLGRLLRELTPDPEASALLALMLFHDSRRLARTAADGRLVLLADQDRTLWDRAQIAEAERLLAEAESTGAYALQAGIAAVHAGAAEAAATDWPAIVALYDRMLVQQWSPVAALNRAVAVSMVEGPAAGLALVEELLQEGALQNYHFAHAARADFCRQLGRTGEARAAYARALDLARQEPERQFLQQRLQELGNQGD
jgi:RNA polymerase sigma-70 factor (ECF subfamily)